MSETKKWIQIKYLYWCALLVYDTV